ncbi:MAG: hypothetical protein ACOYWZ_08975 [Bacillota bacterium]
MKKYLVSVGIIVFYIITMLIFSILQGVYSDDGFIFKEYSGKYVQNFIITVLFLAVSFNYGFLSFSLAKPVLMYSLTIMWLTVLLLYIAAYNDLLPDFLEIPVLAIYIVFYPLMCGISYIGIIDSYSNADLITFIVFGIFVPFSFSAFGYYAGHFISERKKKGI